MRKLTLFSTLLLLALAAHADPVPFTLTVSPLSISGHAGDTIGWGFTLTDTDDTLYVVPIGSDYCTGPISSPCTTTLGAYNDIITFSVFDVAPGETQTQSFDFAGFTGFGGIQLDPSLDPQTLQGTLVLYYNLYDGDPLVDGVQVGGQFEYDVENALVTVLGEDTTPPDDSTVPEPASFVLLASGLTSAWTLRRLTKSE